jgi:SAM-dependent methyltransferase
MLMAQTFPNSRFTGYDLSENGIAGARAEAQQQGLVNVHFEQLDGAILYEVNCYDLICTFDAIHDQAKPAAVLGNINRALKPDGVYLMQDIAGSSHVHNNLIILSAVSLYYLLHALYDCFAGRQGDGLGGDVGREKVQQMLAEVGFGGVEVRTCP